ncbi:Acg family FMN-binding oxidoreductase [Vitreimonas flagellata]|uniref:Acg family FMN-binding oxidoreductase n=1 Tax=Vitreimonas flagellata TaxID=2560861 RepID=UPI00107569B1|nr:nitroreductase family protein [Vitreimonas flagellata]
MLSRRHVLAVLAAAPLAPSLSGCAPSDLPDPIAAWRMPGAGETDPRRFALAHAILAPNPHNRQPWLIELVGDNEFVFRVDLERLLPATDPFNRQIVLGCGAFLEMFDLAARANGYRAEITLWPDGEPQPLLDARPIAHVRLTPEALVKDPLFDLILARRTNREAYEDRAIPDDVLEAMRAAAGDAVSFNTSTSGALREDLRRLAWDAFETEILTPAAYQESVDLMRIGAADIARHRDGLVLDGPMIEFARATGLLNNEIMADVNNPLVKQGYEAYRPLALNAPAFAWITTADNTRTTQIGAGRAYARVNLAAAGAGLGMHPWSQSLQEYPEMADLMVEAESLMNAPGDARVQMFVRVGYARQVGPSPRRGLAEHISA